MATIVHMGMASCAVLMHQGCACETLRPSGFRTRLPTSGMRCARSGAILVGVYRERPSTIAGAVAWESVVTESRSDILPDGCMDLIWHDGLLFIAGPDTQ